MDTIDDHPENSDDVSHGAMEGMRADADARNTCEDGTITREPTDRQFCIARWGTRQGTMHIALRRLLHEDFKIHAAC